MWRTPDQRKRETKQRLKGYSNEKPQDPWGERPEKPTTQYLGRLLPKGGPHLSWRPLLQSHEKDSLLPGTLTIFWCYRVSAEGARSARSLREPPGEVLGYALRWRNHSPKGGHVVEGEISSLSWRETLGLMVTIWAKFQNEWDSGKDINSSSSSSFFAKVLINGLHSGTDRRGDTKVVASFIVLISENRAK